MKSSWIVVANGNSARVFTAETQSSALIELKTFVHSEGRLHDRELTSDLPGRNKGMSGTGGHAFEQRTDPKKHEIELFAHQLVQYLESSLNEHKFKQLLLVAEPSFLGLLRNGLSPQLKKLVCFELASNITSQSSAEIRGHLPELLPVL